MFSHLPDKSWAKFLWFKGHTINLAIFCWMDFVEGLKTSNKLHKCGLGPSLQCCFGSLSIESRRHLFSECPFTWNLIKELLPSGIFFLLEPSLLQVLQHSQPLDHKIKRMSYLLVILVIVYIIWKERNAKLFNKESSSFQ